MPSHYVKIHWMIFPQMNMVYMIWPEMYGNGLKIGIIPIIIKTAQSEILSVCGKIKVMTRMNQVFQSGSPKGDHSYVVKNIVLVIGQAPAWLQTLKQAFLIQDSVVWSIQTKNKLL